MNCLMRKLKNIWNLICMLASNNVISMNAITSNAMEKSKLGKASFYENDLFP
jgi:hypothetical protein